MTARTGRAHHTDTVTEEGAPSSLCEGWMVRTCPALGHHFAHSAVDAKAC